MIQGAWGPIAAHAVHTAPGQGPLLIPALNTGPKNGICCWFEPNCCKGPPPYPGQAPPFVGLPSQKDTYSQEQTLANYLTLSEADSDPQTSEQL